MTKFSVLALLISRKCLGAGLLCSSSSMESIIQPLIRLLWLSPEVRLLWTKIQPHANASWFRVLMKDEVDVSHRNEKPSLLDLESTPIGKFLEAQAIAGGPPILLATVLVTSQIFRPLSLSRKTLMEIERQQLELGIAAEFLHLSQSIHGGDRDRGSSDDLSDIKLRTLAGDFCITRFFSCLAHIEHGGVTRNMMECLAWCAEQNFDRGGDASGDNHLEGRILQTAITCAAMLAGHSQDEPGSPIMGTAANLGTICAKLLLEARGHEDDSQMSQMATSNIDQDQE